MTSSKFMYLACKRLFDFVVAVAALVVLSPVMAAVAILIKFDSPGPAIYRGLRIGKHGRPFRMLKFRTMIVNADVLGSTATAHRDPRITRVGHYLRHFKIDEFPQLINVLRGEMSLVGPRPEVEEHTSAYTEEEREILSVTPGITDFSSIRFINLGELLGTEDANRVFIEKYRSTKNRLRLEYVRNQSFLTDARILLLTARQLLVRRA